MIAPRNQKLDQRKDRNRNASGGGGRGLAEIVDALSQSLDDAAKALQTDRRGSISFPPSSQDNGTSGKLAEIKARIVELLDLIEALQPGFAKDVAPKLEPDMAAVPIVKIKVGDREASLTPLEELADLLEELVDLLRNRMGEDEGEGPSEGAMEAVAFGYEKAAGKPRTEKEPRGVEMFMSIYDQLSPEGRMEVVEILAAMAFGGDDHERGRAGPIQSLKWIEPRPADTANEFIGTAFADYGDNPTYRTLQSYQRKAFDLLGENDVMSFEFLVDVVALIAGGGNLTDRFDLTAIPFDMPQDRAASEMEAFLAALEQAVVLLGNGQDRDARNRLSSAVDQSSPAAGCIATEFLLAGLGAKVYERFFSFNKEGVLDAVTPFDQKAVFEFVRKIERKTKTIVVGLRDLNIFSGTRYSISNVFHKILAQLEMLWEAEYTMATVLYDIESASPGFLKDLTQMISDNHTQAPDSIPDGFDFSSLDRANGIDQIMMRVELGQFHFNNMWASFIDLSSMAGRMEKMMAQRGADRAAEAFMSRFGQLDAQFQKEVEQIITGIRDGKIVPPHRKR
jgi:hypothetical protein